MGVKVDDPVYLSRQDNPKDSPSILPGDPNIPLVQQRWNETQQKWVPAVGGARHYNKKPLKGRLDSRKCSRIKDSWDTFDKVRKHQPELIKRNIVMDASWLLVKGPAPSARQQRKPEDATDELGVIHAYVPLSPPRTPDTVVTTTAVTTTLEMILSQFPPGNLALCFYTNVLT